MRFLYLLLSLACFPLMAKDSAMNVKHHINLGKSHFNNQLNNSGHLHLAGGLASMGVSTMAISDKMKKDFYLLSSATTLLGVGHYLSSVESSEKELGEKFANDKDLYKDEAVRDEHRLHSLAEQAKTYRYYSSAALIAAGAGYIAYYYKYKDNNEQDAHRASLASLIIGVGKTMAGFGQLFHQSYLEKVSTRLISKSSKFALDLSIDVNQNAPMLLVHGRF